MRPRLSRWFRIAKWSRPPVPRPGLEELECRYAPATFTVNSLGDGPDNNPGDGIASTGVVGVGGPEVTLRAALMEANATPGTDTILFNLPGPGPIVLGSPLPVVTDPVVIDGTFAGGGGDVVFIGVVVSGAALVPPPDQPLIFAPGSTGSQLRGVRFTGFGQPTNGGGVIADVAVRPDGVLAPPVAPAIPQPDPTPIVPPTATPATPPTPTIAVGTAIVLASSPPGALPPSPGAAPLPVAPGTPPLALSSPAETLFGDFLEGGANVVGGEDTVALEYLQVSRPASLGGPDVFLGSPGAATGTLGRTNATPDVSGAEVVLPFDRASRRVIFSEFNETDDHVRHFEALLQGGGPERVPAPSSPPVPATTPPLQGSRSESPAQDWVALLAALYTFARAPRPLPPEPRPREQAP